MINTFAIFTFAAMATLVVYLGASFLFWTFIHPPELFAAYRAWFLIFSFLALLRVWLK